MRYLTAISKKVSKFCVKVSLVALIVGLSTMVAQAERKARLEQGRAMPVPISTETLSSEKPGPRPVTTIGLAPDPYLLDQVKEQTRQKPLFDKKSTRYDGIIEEAARRHRISPTLVKAVIQAESKFDTRAVSAQGAVGLMQILPSTARSMGISSPQEPYNNITAGVRYLKMLLEEFGNDEYLALAAYNCGPEAIKRYGGKMPPYSETKSFVAQVMRYYQSHIES
jgi:hypothetical protein